MPRCDAGAGVTSLAGAVIGVIVISALIAVPA
jgi:hypothetical protein